MDDIPSGSDLSDEELADLIYKLADLVSGEQLSFDLQAITSIQEALVERKHSNGAKLVNRISLLAGNESEAYKYGYAKETAESMEPLDPEKDAERLRQLAQEIESDE